ncbi:competence protein ComYC [Staphylococcus capitis subsp. capitis]|nr:competence protein ComYC [Staphylococcus capitis subsp. capitis]
MKIKAFTFVEILFALSVTLLCLSLTPNIINLTSYYLHLAKNNDDLDFEFFCRDILKDIQTSKYSPSKDNDSTIKIRKKDEEIRYIYNNKKIYKNINQRGNITLLNNVVFF